MNKLTYKDGHTNREVSIEFDKDSNTSDWKSVIKSIMVLASFEGHQLDFLDIEDE